MLVLTIGVLQQTKRGEGVVKLKEVQKVQVSNVLSIEYNSRPSHVMPNALDPSCNG
jgi:hypothetical protein